MAAVKTLLCINIQKRKKLSFIRLSFEQFINGTVIMYSLCLPASHTPRIIYFLRITRGAIMSVISRTS